MKNQNMNQFWGVNIDEHLAQAKAPANTPVPECQIPVTIEPVCYEQVSRRRGPLYVALLVASIVIYNKRLSLATNFLKNQETIE